MHDANWYARCLLGVMAHPRARELALDLGVDIWPGLEFRILARSVVVDGLDFAGLYEAHKADAWARGLLGLMYPSGTPSEEGTLSMLREAAFAGARPRLLGELTTAATLTASGEYDAIKLGRALKHILDELRGIVTAGKEARSDKRGKEQATRAGQGGLGRGDVIT